MILITLTFWVFTTHTKPCNAFALPVIQYIRTEAVANSQYIHRQVNSNKYSSLFTSSYPQWISAMGQGETHNKLITLCPLTTELWPYKPSNDEHHSDVRLGMRENNYFPSCQNQKYCHDTLKYSHYFYWIVLQKLQRSERKIMWLLGTFLPYPS